MKTVAIACQGGGSHTAFTGGHFSVCRPKGTTESWRCPEPQGARSALCWRGMACWPAGRLRQAGCWSASGRPTQPPRWDCARPRPRPRQQAGPQARIHPPALRCGAGAGREFPCRAAGL